MQHARPDRARGVLSALQGNLGDAGQQSCRCSRCARCPRRQRSRDGRERSDRARRSRARPDRSRHRASAPPATPRRPPSRVRCALARARPATTTPSSSTCSTAWPVRISTPRLVSLARAPSDSCSEKDGRMRGPASTRMIFASRGLMCRNSVGIRANSCESSPASSQPVGPAPTSTKVISCCAEGRIVRLVSLFERTDDAPAQELGVRQRLHASVQVAPTRRARNSCRSRRWPAPGSRTGSAVRRPRAGPVADPCRRRPPRPCARRRWAGCGTIVRMGVVIVPGSSSPAATWYSSGWNRW